MIDSIISRTVDLDRPVQKDILRDLFVTEDKQAHTFKIHITRSGADVDLAGAIVTGYFMRYKDKVSVPLEGRVDGNALVLTLSDGCYTLRTMFGVTVCALLGDVKHAVYFGEGQMLANRTDSISDPENVIPSLEDIIAQYDTMQIVTSETRQAAESASAAAGSANAAAKNADTAADGANTAASGASTAADRANTAAAALEGMTVTSEDTGPDTEASAEVSDVDGVKNIHFKLRQGEKGDTGEMPSITFTADTGDPGTDVQITQSGTVENPVVNLTIPRGIPGSGSVSSINGVYPDTNGNVDLAAEDVGALAADGTAINSDKLGGKAPDFYHPNYYVGTDLTTVFASAADFAADMRAGDFSKIRVGDHWPITLNGSYYDYATSETKSVSNAVMKMEVAGIDSYYRYGDAGDLANGVHHLIMISRDLFPNTMQMRSENSTWYDTNQVNPWLGSHYYQTLNNASNGIINLVAATELGAYIYAGPNGAGMRALLEQQAAGAATPTGWAWADRGKLWLPNEVEVWGEAVWQDFSWTKGLHVHFPIFGNSLRRTVKGLGNGGSRYTWWCGSASSATNFTFVSNTGFPSRGEAAANWLSVPLCFIMA